MYTTYKALKTTSVGLYRGGYWRQPVLFAKLWIQGLLNFRIVSQIYTHTGFGNVSQVIADEPHFLGVLVWPLVDARWGPQRRLQELMRHYREAAAIGNLLELQPKETKSILKLESISPTLEVCLERQPWFAREGQLTLSLFNAGQRVYSIAFLLSQDRGRRVAYVGAVQGVKQAEDDETYKLLTKAAHGLRPRDLTIALFLLMCDAMRVDRVLAVRDKNRQHHHTYFGASGKAEVYANYDAIWSENGARLRTDDVFVLAPGVREKDLSTVPSKKRSMYRKRHEFLAECLAAFQHVVQSSICTQNRRQYERSAPAPLWSRPKSRHHPIYARYLEWVARVRPALFGSWLWSCPVIFM